MNPSRRYVWGDTSFFYALFIEADINHDAALRIWKECLHKRIECITSNLIAAELGTLLAYRFRHSIASEKMRLFLDSSLVHRVYARSDIESCVLNWWQRFSDQKFSFVDCVSFEFMLRMELSYALSFDADFDIAGFITVRKPEILN